MLFNSWAFIPFIIVFFLAYWFLFNNNVKYQNAFIAFGSFIFYGLWDVRFLLLLWLSLIVDFAVGYYLEKTEAPQKRKLLIWFSVLFNIGLLMFFKYFNFFSQSAGKLFSLFGLKADFVTLNLVLPIGISFYTFQSLSYTLEVYKRKLKGTSDLVSYAAFIGFFPQLVAGPIERAANMLPQFYKPRSFDYSKCVGGLQLILWGLFKKVVVADTCAKLANNAFDNYRHLDGSYLIFGAIYFSFQIYGDFSGYTDIARGLGKLLGFDLKINFMYPYFSRNIGEFWRRWHISLSSWFRDYLYIPLGGSLGSKSKTLRNTAIVFLVSGFWHGANWTFICWGALHGLYYVPLVAMNKHKTYNNTVAENKNFPNAKELVSILTTFALVVFAWIFFRSDSLQNALEYIRRIFSIHKFDFPGKYDALLVVVAMLIIDWVGRHHESALSAFVRNRHFIVRYTVYMLLGLWVYANFSGQNEFIYFRF